MAPHGKTMHCRLYNSIKIIRTENKILDPKTKCGRFAGPCLSSCEVLGEESYFTLSDSIINDKKCYYASNSKTTFSSMKYIKKKRFETKVLVWIEIG